MLFDAQILAQMFIVGVVTPTLHLVGDEPEIGIVHQGGDGLILHDQRLGLMQDLGAGRGVALLIGLLHQRIEFGVFIVPVIEGLVGADVEIEEVLGVGIVGGPAGARNVELAAFLQVG